MGGKDNQMFTLFTFLIKWLFNSLVPIVQLPNLTSKYSLQDSGELNTAVSSTLLRQEFSDTKKCN